MFDALSPPMQDPAQFQEVGSINPCRIWGATGES